MKIYDRNFEDKERTWLIAILMFSPDQSNSQGFFPLRFNSNSRPFSLSMIKTHELKVFAIGMHEASDEGAERALPSFNYHKRSLSQIGIRLEFKEDCLWICQMSSQLLIDTFCTNLRSNLQCTKTHDLMHAHTANHQHFNSDQIQKISRWSRWFIRSCSGNMRIT